MRRLLVFMAIITLAACGKSGDDESERAQETETTETTGTAGDDQGGEPGAEAVAEAEKIFQNRCTPCHGASGKGDGPASAGLDPKPRDYTDPAWQEEVTDEHIEKIIMYGGAAVGRSPAMPANPDLQSKPEVVKALRQHIRNLAP